MFALDRYKFRIYQAVGHIACKYLHYFGGRSDRICGHYVRIYLAHGLCHRFIAGPCNHSYFRHIFSFFFASFSEIIFMALPLTGHSCAQMPQPLQ